MKFSALVIGSALSAASAFSPQTLPRRTFAVRASSHGHHVTMSTVLPPLVGKNVVLTHDPSGFDSLKIGGARVHCYARESGAESEYLMWYHASTSSDPPADGEAPIAPLSSGSIGIARSRNGLAWQRDAVGATTEGNETPGVCLGPNVDAWWEFDTAHVGLGQVMTPMSGTTVISEGGVYIMYYFGGSFEETDLSAYGGPESGGVKGMKMRIGVAVSQDGLSWGRVEGDDPTGACMGPYDLDDDNSNSFIDMNAPKPKDIEEELYTAWPEVITSEGANTSYTMFYSTMTKKKKEKCIALGKSKNGFKWYKGGVILRPGPDEFDINGVARCHVIKDAVFENGLWKENEKMSMFYEGIGSDNRHKVCLATSDDEGLTWTKQGIAFDFGVDGEWDSSGVGSPHVLRLADGTIRMYYTGQSSDGRTAIGVARLSGPNLGGPWEREDSKMPTFAES